MQPATNGETYADTGVGAPDRLTRLWAPYRSSYIAAMPDGAARQGGEAAEGASRSAGDPFLEIPKMSDEDGLIVARGTTVYAVCNLYPYNAGHLMVVPYRKVADLEALTDEETAELMEFAKHAVKTLKAVSKPEAINVGLNLGKASGGSVGDHLHLHVVPRWAGDSNFMTVIGGTKVLPQLLQDTRALLADGWRELQLADEAEETEGTESDA